MRLADQLEQLEEAPAAVATLPQLRRAEQVSRAAAAAATKKAAQEPPPPRACPLAQPVPWAELPKDPAQHRAAVFTPYSIVSRRGGCRRASCRVLASIGQHRR